MTQTGRSWTPPRWTAPRILGVLNITADSFSDGGRFLDPAAAIAQARALADDGADIVDIGAVASNPDSAQVSIDEEIRRLDPVITALHDRGVAVSVDSFRPATQRYAIGRGVAFLNDIHGFAHAHMHEDLARAGRGLILMHSVHGAAHITRADIAVDDIVERILRFFRQRLDVLERAGIARARIVLDPGMGYFLGANPAASFAALAATSRIRDVFGLPVLIAVSRKSFLRTATGRSNPAAAGPASLAAELYAALAGAAYIRTHDAAALRDGLRVLAAVKEREA